MFVPEAAQFDASTLSSTDGFAIAYTRVSDFGVCEAFPFPDVVMTTERTARCVPRPGVIAVSCLLLVAYTAVRVDAFASSALLPRWQQSEARPTTPRAPTAAISMSSSSRQGSDQGLPPGREEGKRRTPQQIAGV